MKRIDKPHAESCDRNQQPILDVIGPRLLASKTVLEIGSGTGQHAVFFARHLPHLVWISSDKPENHPGIRQWQKEANLTNTEGPLKLDLSNEAWPEIEADVVFTANTVHIVSWTLVVALFKGSARLLPSGGLFMIYGPFNYGGNYSSESNARFDQWLKNRDSDSGIRGYEDLEKLARSFDLEPSEDIMMPANNRLLVWRRT